VPTALLRRLLVGRLESLDELSCTHGIRWECLSKASALSLKSAKAKVVTES